MYINGFYNFFSSFPDNQLQYSGSFTDNQLDFVMSCTLISSDLSSIKANCREKTIKIAEPCRTGVCLLVCGVYGYRAGLLAGFLEDLKRAVFA